MRNLLIITGDTNDADYISSEHWLSPEELETQLPLLQKVGTLLANRSGHNWGTSEFARDKETPTALYVETGLLTEEEYEEFDELVPYGEHGIHTISSIVLHKVVSTINLMTP